MGKTSKSANNAKRERAEIETIGRKNAKVSSDNNDKQEAAKTNEASSIVLRIERLLSRCQLLSQAETVEALDLAIKNVRSQTFDKTAWTLLDKVIQLPGLDGRRILGQSEKLLVDSLSDVCTGTVALDTESLQACQATWGHLSSNLGYRPKLEKLTSITAQCQHLHEIVARELLRALEAEVDRKAFEAVCKEPAVLASLIHMSVAPSLTDSVRVASKAVLALAIFRSDAEDEISKAGVCFRVQAENENKKRTNQNNWRSLFWATLRTCIEKQMVPAKSSFTLLCELHRQRKSNKTVMIWFEMIHQVFTHSQSPEYSVDALEDLLNFGLSCYEPTVEEDLAALEAFAQSLIESKKLVEVNLVRVISSILTLDYRSVESNLGAFFDDSLCGNFESRTRLLLATLNSFLATRRAHQWIAFVARVTKDPWLETDGQLQSQQTYMMMMSEMFTSKLLDHQTPQVWKAYYEDLGMERLTKHEFLLSSFGAFISSLNCGIPLGEDFVAKIHESLRVGCGLISSASKKSLRTGSIIVSASKLVRSCAAVLDLSGNALDEEDRREMKKIFDLKKMETLCKGLKSQLDAQIVIEEFTNLVLVLSDADNDELIAETFYLALQVSPSFAAQCLLRYSTRRITDKFSVELCGEIWKRIARDKSREFVELLSRASFYEIKPMREGFVRQFLSNPSDDMIWLASELPRGFLDAESLKEMVHKLKQMGSISKWNKDALCAWILRSLSPQSPELIEELIPFQKTSKKDDESFLVEFLKVLSEYEAKKELLSALIGQMKGDLDVIVQLVVNLERNNEWELVPVVMLALAGCLRLPQQQQQQSEGEDEEANDANKQVLDSARKVFSMVQKMKINKEEADGEMDLAQMAAQLQLGGSIASHPLANPAMELTISSIPLGKCLTKCTQNSNGIGERLFMEALASNFIHFRPSLDATSFGLVASLLLAHQVEIPTLVAKCASNHFAVLVESLLIDAWSTNEPARLLAASNLKSILETRLQKGHRKVLIRFSKPIVACLGRMIERNPNENAVWQALISFISAKYLRESLTSNDCLSLFIAMTGSIHPLKIRFLQMLSESHSSILTGQLAAAFIRSIAACEREIIFNNNDDDMSEKTKISCAMDLARLGDSLVAEKNAFKHLVVGLLSDHVTLCYYKGITIEALKRPLDMYAFALLDLCGERELQQLHAVLGGGAGGARRDMLKRLVEEHQRSHVFKGKI